jgi:DNA-binding MarR family transcriptional regulator
MASLEQELKQSKFENEILKANINVLFTANWLYNKISANLKPYNLTHEQFNVLRILKGSHPECMCQKDILSRMIAPNSNVTLIIKKLIDKKFIRVLQSAKDKREYKINITSQGIKVLEEIEIEFKNTKDFFSKLNSEEAFQLNSLLEKLRLD